MVNMPENLKGSVKEYWETEPCNTRYVTSSAREEYFRELVKNRYESEPNILELAGFDSAPGLKVLEIGVGAGADFVSWIRGGACVTGVDFTEAGVTLTKENVSVHGFENNRHSLLRADAENLPLRENAFDVVFSYGVLHHTPDTRKAFQEAHRVLKSGGDFRCMIYHTPSWALICLWLYHALLGLKPWKSLSRVAYEHLESPGTKTYTASRARALCEACGFKDVKIKLYLDNGDLLNLQLGPKYKNNGFVKACMKIYPRALIRLFGSRLGTTMHITATKL